MCGLPCHTERMRPRRQRSREKKGLPLQGKGKEMTYQYGRNSPINGVRQGTASAATAGSYALAAGAGAVAVSAGARAAVMPFGGWGPTLGFGPIAAGVAARLIPVIGAASLAYGVYRLLRFIPVLGAPSSAQLAATGWTIARYCEEGNTRGDSSEGPVCGDIYNFSERRNNGSIIRTWFKTGYTISGPLGRFGYRAERTAADPYAPRSRGPAALPAPAGVTAPGSSMGFTRPLPGAPARPVPASVAPLVDGYAVPNSGADPPMATPFRAVAHLPARNRHAMPYGPDRGYRPIPAIPPLVGTDIQIGGGVYRPVVTGDRPAVAAAAPAPPIREIKAPNSKATMAAIAAFRALSWASEASDLVDAVHKSLPKKYRKGKTQGEKLKDLWDHWNKLPVDKTLWNVLQNQLQDAAIGSLYGAGRLAADRLDPSGQLWRTYQTYRSNQMQAARIRSGQSAPSHRTD